MAAHLVTLGDSVHWGQGLLQAHKLHTLVGSEMRKTQPGLVDHFLAHSGATIGVGATVKRQRVHGEVPIAYPTILEQVEGFFGAPADATVVLVNGGINDIDIRNITQSRRFCARRSILNTDSGHREHRFWRIMNTGSGHREHGFRC